MASKLLINRSSAQRLNMGPNKTTVIKPSNDFVLKAPSSKLVVNAKNVHKLLTTATNRCIYCHEKLADADKKWQIVSANPKEDPVRLTNVLRERNKWVIETRNAHMRMMEVLVEATNVHGDTKALGMED